MSKYWLVLGLTLTLMGCLEVTPTDPNITVTDGQSLRFSAGSDIEGAQVAWTLDGEAVGTGNEYTLMAVNTSANPTQHELSAAEKGGTSVKPRETHTWSITVLPLERPILPPVNVSATQADPALYDPEHLDVTVTWEPDPAGATAEYYRVYRRAWEAEGDYELVGDHIEGISFVYTQTWEKDVAAKVPPQPALSPEPSDQERKLFIQNLKAYQDALRPHMLNFKAPAYFKVEACTALGCSEPSAPDFGTAELLHTEVLSEANLLSTSAWSYPFFIALADMPAGVYATEWCGFDVCGPGGGLFMGRLEVHASRWKPGVHIDMVFDNYTERLDSHPSDFAVVNGMLNGIQEFSDFERNNVIFAGTLNADLGGALVGLEMYAHFNVDFAGYNTSWAAITYKGRTFQSTLPVNPQAEPVDGIYVAEPIQPIVPMVLTKPDWLPSQHDYPIIPAAEDDYVPFAGCVHNADETIFPAEPQCTEPSHNIWYYDADGGG